MQTPTAPPSRTALAWLAGPFVTVLLLVGIEAAARVVATFTGMEPPVDLHRQATWFEYSATLGWERRPGFHGSHAGADREFDNDGYLLVDSAQVRDTSGFHVMFAGGSHTMASGVSAESTFAEVVEWLLPGVQSVNLGVLGYSSYQTRVLIDQYLPKLQPDLLVVEAGGNDPRIVASPAGVDGPERFRSSVAAAESRAGQLARLLQRSYAVLALRRVLQTVGLVAAPPAEINIEDLSVRVDTGQYRANLQAIASMAAETHTPLLFVLFGDSPLDNYDLRKGLAAFRARDYVLAQAHLRVPIQRDVDGAELARKHVAAMYRAEGDSARADSTLRIPPKPVRLDGGYSLFADTVYHDIMRQVGRERGVEVVDAVTMLEQHPEVFSDRSGHFDGAGHRLVANLLAPHIARARAGRAR